MAGAGETEEVLAGNNGNERSCAIIDKGSGERGFRETVDGRLGDETVIETDSNKRGMGFRPNGETG